MRRRLQPYGREAATVCGAGCNRMGGRLQPYAAQAASVCTRGAGARLQVGGTRPLHLGEHAQHLERRGVRAEAPKEVLPVRRVGQARELREGERRASEHLRRLGRGGGRVRVRDRGWS